jgi:hypothetical protein
MHPLPPHLSATLIRQRRMNCPCGAHSGRPNALCRKCRHTAQWRRHAGNSTRTARRMAAQHVRHTPVLIALALLLRGGRS